MSSSSYKLCFCGHFATVQIQDEIDNYGIRFYGCPNRGTYDVSKPNNVGGCTYIEYYDPPFGDRANEVIRELLMEKQELINKNTALAKYVLKKITSIHANDRRP
jgi:hypothetical protein